MMPPKVKLQDSDQKKIVEVLRKAALTAAGSSRKFFEALIDGTSWPLEWKTQCKEGLSSNSRDDARRLVAFAASRGRIPGDPQVKTLASLLLELTQYLDLDDLRFTAAVVDVYGLISDPALAAQHRMRYQIPTHALPEDRVMDVPAIQAVPKFEWDGPTDELALQAFVHRDAVFTVDFLRKAAERAYSVCQVEIPSLHRCGTGFLVAPGLVLTNHHVLQRTQDEDPAENAAQMMLRFGNYKSDLEDAADGQVVPLAETNPVLAVSPWDRLDYALLRADGSIEALEGITPLPFQLGLPEKRSALNILQHPDCGEMKVALSRNGVTRVMPETGKIQYVASVSGGSSGAPCFNENWELVAVHHAGISGAFTKGEGILFSAIYEQIKDKLNGN